MMKNRLWAVGWALVVVQGVVACGDFGTPGATGEAEVLGSGAVRDSLVHPEWSRNATIYEVNIRQHTPEGTLQAFRKDLPRLQGLGVDILWLMPIHPIGEVNRKGGENTNNYIAEPGSGSLGSPYSVKDYYAVNPDYGTLEDLKAVVADAHRLGMKVILDWVANHTAFDSEWTTSHPEYFLRDSLGKLQPPLGTDWWDVTQLDWERADANGLSAAMTDALLFWVREADIDGYRCDVAMKVPTSFWNQARVKLEQAKPDIFMLAEAEQEDHHDRAFDMSYAWHAHHLFNEVARRTMPIDSLRAYLKHELERFGREPYRMTFVTNHDENSWNGTTTERMGANGPAMAVVAGTWFGMPLIYSGQESGETKRLRFFEKDTVAWGGYPQAHFFRAINTLHHEEEALWNGAYGAWPEEIPTAHPQDVLMWRRTQGASDVIVAVNLSDGPRNWAVEWPEGRWENALGHAPARPIVTLPAHGYAVWRKADGK